MWLIIAARVVDLPEPVGPVTKINPEPCSTTSLNVSGRLNCSMVKISVGMVRITAAMPSTVRI